MYTLRSRLRRGSLDKLPHVRGPVVARDVDVAHGGEAQLRVDLDLWRPGKVCISVVAMQKVDEVNKNSTHIGLVGCLDDERGMRLRGLK